MYKKIPKYYFDMDIFFSFLSIAFLGSSALADSCWDHNGSLMRLVANGNQRLFYYELPKRVLRNAGVKQGTLLFNGRKNGSSYIGTARRFSKYCPEGIAPT